MGTRLLALSWARRSIAKQRNRHMAHGACATWATIPRHSWCDESAVGMQKLCAKFRFSAFFFELGLRWRQATDVARSLSRSQKFVMCVCVCVCVCVLLVGHLLFDQHFRTFAPGQ